MKNSYINQPVTSNELRSLTELAIAEEKAFFVRNPCLVRSYRQRLILVALCQGAALQYLGCGRGVKDFDVHFFVRAESEQAEVESSCETRICVCSCLFGSTNRLYPHDYSWGTAAYRTRGSYSDRSRILAEQADSKRVSFIAKGRDWALPG